MDKYLVTLELRYATKGTEEERGDYMNPKITLGVYDSVDDANAQANALLREMEGRYPLHVFPDGRKAARPIFGEPYGHCGPLALVSEMAYLKTPFCFFLSVKRLKYADPMETMTHAEKEIKG